MNETRRKRRSEAVSEISLWVDKHRQLEKGRILQRSKIFEEDTTLHTDHHLAGVKVLHGLDKIAEGLVLTLKDQPILADGDVNEELDMLENAFLAEQEKRDEAYKAAKKKTGPKYDDPATEEGITITLDERGGFSKLEEELLRRRRRLTGVSRNNFEDLTSSRKVSLQLQFKEPKMKKYKLDINALEAEAISSGLGVGDLGSREDVVKRQAIKVEQERLEEAEMRNNAYHYAYAKADEASKLLRLEQTHNVKTEQVFADDDDEDLRKSLDKARRLALKKQGEGAAGESRENKVVFTEMEEFVRGLARKPKDVFMRKDETGGWTEVKESIEEEQPNSEEDKEIVLDETIHEVAVGKGLSGALKLLRDRGMLKESIDECGGGRNMDKKKSNLVGIVDDDGGKEAQNNKEIHIERTDEFGRILTPKEAFRLISHKFHGKGPGKMKQEKRMKQYYQELKMKTSDTPLLSVERMRETQSRLKTPYLVLT